jgi:protein-S-isoprenylcysteine O-methyltransferase Ste14
MTVAYAVLAGVCLLGLAVRTGYELLKKAGKVDTTNTAVFTVVFVAMCVMLGSWLGLGRLDPWRVPVPGAVRWLGLGAVLAALALEIGALLLLRALENVDHLVTTGLFSRLRHPMYTGFILWIAGWVIRYGALASLAVGLVCVVNILYWRRLEEAALESRYGDAYRLYRRTTWF